MNRRLNLYVYGVIAVGIAVILYTTILIPLKKSIDWIFCVMFISLIITDVVAVEFTRGFAISFGGSLICFAILCEPIIYVLMLIFLSLIFSEIIRRFLNRNKKILKDLLTKQMLYNISSLFIISFIVSRFSYVISYELSLAFYLRLLLFTTTYSLLNIVSLAFVMAQIQNVIFFTKEGFNLLVNNLFFTFIIVTILFLMKYAFGVLGVILLAFFLLPFNGIVINNMSGLQITKKLNSDKLTSILNRGYLEEIIVQKLRLKQNFILLFLDIDKFKVINDTYGHMAGDAVLVAFSKEFEKHLRKEDNAFRYGGDEFCILFDNQDQALKYKARMEELGKSYICEYNNHQIEYSYSMGFLEFDGLSETTFSKIIDEVDQKMYLDKRRVIN